MLIPQPRVHRDTHVWCHCPRLCHPSVPAVSCAPGHRCPLCCPELLLLWFASGSEHFDQHHPHLYLHACRHRTVCIVVHFGWIQCSYTLAPWIWVYPLLEKLPYSKLADQVGVTLHEKYFFGRNVVWEVISRWQDQQAMARDVLGANPGNGRRNSSPISISPWAICGVQKQMGPAGCGWGASGWKLLLISPFHLYLSQVSIWNNFWITAGGVDSAGIDSNCLQLGGRLRIIISKTE